MAPGAGICTSEMGAAIGSRMAPKGGSVPEPPLPILLPSSMCHSLKHSAVTVSTIGHVCLSGTSFKCICTHTSARLRHLRVTRVVGGGLETGCSDYQERVAPEPPARVVGGRLETGWSGYQERVAHYLYDGHSGPRD